MFLNIRNCLNVCKGMIHRLSPIVPSTSYTPFILNYCSVFIFFKRFACIFWAESFIIYSKYSV